MFDVNRVLQVMSEIFSDKYGVKITLKAVSKDNNDGCEETEQAKAG